MVDSAPCKNKTWLTSKPLLPSRSTSAAWLLVPLGAMAIWQGLSGVPPIGYYLETAPDTKALEHLVSAALTAPGPTLQNAAHVPYFAAVVWLWCWSLAPHTTLRSRVAVSATIAASFAVVNELTQLYVPYRDASLTDIGLNLAGVAFGLSAYSLAWRQTSGHSRPAA